MKPAILVAFGLVLAFGHHARAAGTTIAIVAAENFYGDIARQIGGEHVTVTSILNNPDQDPHLFETTPTVARSLSEAQFVILNGAAYDPWMQKLLAASPRPNRVSIVAAELVNKKAGDNPHLWYEPTTMPAVAKALAGALSKADAAHAGDYAARLKTVLESLANVDKKVAQLRTKHAGTPVTATEPVFGYMAQALGLQMRNERFQLSVMNDTEPSAKDIAAFENDLKGRKVKLMLYNKQVAGKLTQRMLDIARKSRVPVVGVTETEPANTTLQNWMLEQLSDVEKALATSS
ncbi:MAG: metal ABC transporter solute-binding protein, Zn/Mn family [Pseudolabrys sp.]